MWKNRHAQTPYHRVWRKDNNLAMDSKQNIMVYKNRPEMDFRGLADQTELHVLAATTPPSRGMDACKHGIIRNPHTQRSITTRIFGLPSPNKMESIPWGAENETNRQLPRCNINRRTTQTTDSNRTLFRMTDLPTDTLFSDCSSKTHKKIYRDCTTVSSEGLSVTFGKE
jgi:hypothetical protein